MPIMKTQGAAAMVEQLRAELAELRQALGLLTTLAGAVVMDADNPLGMAQAIHNHVTAELAASQAEKCQMREALEKFMEWWNFSQARWFVWDPDWLVEFKRFALASTSPCPHAAEVERLRSKCGKAADRLVHYEDYPEDEAFVEELRAAAKGHAA